MRIRRRTLVSVLLGLAGFALALALMLPLFVYPRLAQLPADPDATQVQTATGATVLVPDLSSSTGARVRHDQQVTITTHISAAPAPHAAGDVVWQLATRVEVAGFGLLSARVERISLDAHTARPTNCCDDSLATDQAHPAGTPITHAGYLTLPFALGKRDYPAWDVSLNRARTSVFDGETERYGLRAYRFVTANSWLPVGTQELPGAMFGSTAPSVTAVSEYADTRVQYVEPASGASLGLTEQVRQRFRFGDRTVTAMSADLVSLPPTAGELSQYRFGARLLPWVRFRASVVLLALAAAAGLGALLLARPGPAPTRPTLTRAREYHRV